MQTPIYDFVQKYKNDSMIRMHMPGHKGIGPLGIEAYDITEIHGADSLYEADGIIAQSEEHATALFHSGHTFYSTEGSSQCIRAMLHLLQLHHTAIDKPRILAARNVHKSFIYAAALLDLDIQWLLPSQSDSLCQCKITSMDVENAIKQSSKPFDALYLTSPNYLGELLDIAEIADCCHRNQMLLLVDNAHGAYTHFLPESMHPLDHGADLVCDSAHKTLPVLTPGAYLHVARHLPSSYIDYGRQALALFGSTSPSYLILESLDLCNAYLDNHYREKLADKISKINDVKSRLRQRGWKLLDTDPLKITFQLPESLSGQTLAQLLRNHHIECEYAEQSFLVLMLTLENTDHELEHLLNILSDAPTGEPKTFSQEPLKLTQACSIREAVLSPQEEIPVTSALGRICATPNVSCPPAIPIAVSGEIITEELIAQFLSYEITTIKVKKED